jgi:CheY-like chemotaxis protein
MNVKNPAVLIAEDHPVNQKLFALILGKLGYPSIIADDGQEALEKAQAHPELGLVFMDIQMPRMNGYEAAGNLRKLGFDKPIIAVTAGAFPDERENSFKAGIDDVLIKPFKRQDIEVMLRKWIGRRGTARPVKKAQGDQWVIPVEEADIIKPSRARTETLFGGETPAAANEVQAEKKPAAAGTGAVFNPAELMDTFMDNDEMAYSLLCRFIKRTAAQIESIAALREAQSWDDARREAHTIRGASYTMAGKELGNAAARLEAAFKNRDYDEMEAGSMPLAEACGRFKEEAEAFLKSKNYVPGETAAT